MEEKREKAIKFFQDMQECTYGNLEEVDMAIHALEQERNVIEELKNIKEILIEECVYLPFCYKINKIVNERIAELKGEKE